MTPTTPTRSTGTVVRLGKKILHSDNPNVRIVERKLGRENYYGCYHRDRQLIVLDPRLTEKKRCEILLHEALHAIFPTADEKTVTEAARALGRIVWGDGWRRVRS